MYAVGGSSCVGSGTGAPPALALALAVLSCEVAFVSIYLVPCATISTVALLRGKK